MRIVLTTVRKLRSRADFLAYCTSILEAGHPEKVIGEFIQTGKATWDDGDVVTTYELLKEDTDGTPR